MFLVVTIIATIPASYSILLALGNAEKVSRCSPRVLLNLIPVVFFLFAFSYIPIPTALASVNVTTSVISRLIVVGTVFLGVLSGFGAMSNSWELVSESQAGPSDAEVRVAEQALASVQDDLRNRRRDIREPVNKSWMSRVLRGGDDGKSQTFPLNAHHA